MMISFIQLYMYLYTIIKITWYKILMQHAHAITCGKTSVNGRTQCILSVGLPYMRWTRRVGEFRTRSREKVLYSLVRRREDKGQHICCHPHILSSHAGISARAAAKQYQVLSSSVLFLLILLYFSYAGGVFNRKMLDATNLLRINTVSRSLVISKLNLNYFTTKELTTFMYTVQREIPACPYKSLYKSNVDCSF